MSVQPQPDVRRCRRCRRPMDDHSIAIVSWRHTFHICPTSEGLAVSDNSAGGWVGGR